jgi:Tn3 transposase DDE domain-containing protein
MSLSPDIARGNTERPAARKGSANLPARLFLHDLGLLLEQEGPFIKPRREMRHGLMENQTSLEPKQLITDTAGYSDIVFALFWLLGFQFSPRLADIGERAASL